MSFTKSLPLIGGLALVLLSVPPVRAQQKQGTEPSECFSNSVVSVPSRPTFSNGTDTTPCGVIEFEYGWQRQWPGASVHQDNIGGGLRLGITPRLDLHWSSDALVSIADPGGTYRGFGDSWLGFKYRRREQSRHAPALGLMYMAKIPSADSSQGLGSGEVDHALSFLVSKDVRRVHVDFNVIELLAGSSASSATDHSTQFALSGSMPLKGPVGIVIEGYGATELNRETPSFASAMLGFTYKVNPRLTLDGGVDLGITSSAPSKRAFIGMTYAIGNLYSWFNPHHSF